MHLQWLGLQWLGPQWLARNAAGSDAVDKEATQHLTATSPPALCPQAHDESSQQQAASSALAHELEEAAMELQDAKDAGRQLAVLLAAVAEGRCSGEHIRGSGLVDDFLTGRGVAGGGRGRCCVLCALSVNGAVHALRSNVTMLCRAHSVW
jgi:hypothetical protein